MNLLAVAPRYPVPVTEGHSLRVRHLLGNLPSSVSLTLVCGCPEESGTLPADPARELGPSCRAVIAVPTAATTPSRRKVGVVAKLLDTLLPDPLSPGYAIRPGLRREIRAQVQSGRYDAVLFMGFSMFLQLDNRAPALPYVVDMCDSYSLYCRNELRTPGGMRERRAALVNYIWAVRYEQRHCSRARNLILITPADQRSVQRHCPRSRTWSLPNGVDCDYFHGPGGPAPGTGLVFTGVMDYEPNRKAMLFFLREVLPLIRSELPDTSLTIAGRDPGRELQDVTRSTPGVTLTGFQADIRPRFSEAAVYVAPMVSGAGMKNKILEAWAMGKPVVATSIASSGLEVSEGENVLIADSPRLFADKVINVLKDRGLRARLGNAARRTAVERYAWGQLASRLATIVEEARAQKGGRGEAS